MKSICKNAESVYIIEKSKFITKMIKVYSIDETEAVLEKTKIQYPDATHYCYAYIIDNTKRFNDDGEPAGTAGKPILNVLEKNNLNYVLCVVIRYFGGIKLGSGGLVRAYTKSVTSCFEKTGLKELEEYYLIHIEMSYDQLKYIDSLLKNEKIIFKNYDEEIQYTFYIRIQDFIKTEKEIKNHCKHLEILKKQWD